MRTDRVVIHETEAERMDAVLVGFLAESGASEVLLIDRSGQPLAQRGGASHDTVSIAALAAGAFSSTGAMAQLLGDLMKRLKIQLHLTSVVVTHDMRLAKKLADRVVFLHESKALFFGTYPELEKCDEPIVQEFLELDALDLGA